MRFTNAGFYRHFSSSWVKGEQLVAKVLNFAQKKKRYVSKYYQIGQEDPEQETGLQKLVTDLAGHIRS